MRDGTIVYDGGADLYAEHGDDDPSNDEMILDTASGGIRRPPLFGSGVARRRVANEVAGRYRCGVLKGRWRAHSW